MQGFGGEIRKKNAIWKAKSKGKVHPCTGTEALYRLVRPTGVVEVQLYPFMTTELFVGGGSASLFTLGKDPVPIVQETVLASGSVWTGAENLAPPGFHSRTVQPVASHYNDYATRSIHFEDLYTNHLIQNRHVYFGFQGKKIAGISVLVEKILASQGGY